MREIHTNGPPDEPSVWCPKCLAYVPLSDALLKASFSPQAWELHPDGSLDTGPDVFADYDHLECGTHVRLVCNAGWSEELGDYVETNAWLEIEIDGETVAPPKSSGLVAFSGSVEEDTQTWGPTYVAVLDAYKEAVRLLEGMLKGDGK